MRMKEALEADQMVLWHEVRREKGRGKQIAYSLSKTRNFWQDASVGVNSSI